MSSEPTQVKHPWKATLRTVLSYVLAVLTTISLALPIVQETMGHVLPPRALEALAWLTLVTGALVATFTRLMASAAINDQLAKIGFGAEPFEEARRAL